MTHGSFFTLRLGYQLRGIRQIMSRIEMVRMGARIEATKLAVFASISVITTEAEI